MRNTGLLLSGCFRKAGVTIYVKEGQSVARSSMSIQPRRQTAAQFEVRERFHHNRKLWAVVQKTGLINRRQFYPLATKLPVLYLTREEHCRGYTLLMPGTPAAWSHLKLLLALLLVREDLPLLRICRLTLRLSTLRFLALSNAFFAATAFSARRLKKITKLDK